MAVWVWFWSGTGGLLPPCPAEGNSVYAIAASWVLSGVLAESAASTVMAAINTAIPGAFDAVRAAWKTVRPWDALTACAQHSAEEGLGGARA